MTPPPARPHDASAPSDAPDAASTAAVAWDAVVAQIDAALRAHGVPAQRCVVLLPYAQLMATARRAWARRHPTGFAPRFETTRNWAGALQPWQPGPLDLSHDAARDTLVAAALLDAVVRGRLDAGLRRELVARLVESARQLAPLAAAQDPAQRQAWADAAAEALGQGPSHLQWEQLDARLALTWVASSAHATDVLWGPLAAPGADADLLLCLAGHQPDPLVQALQAHWGARSGWLEWPASPVHAPRRQACTDAEDEARWAAACVIDHLNAGRRPVALVALDRLVTRRVSALLAGAGVAVHDETGWKLSTTRAAAAVMALLRAAPAQADTDAVLDLLKQSPAWSDATTAALERALRQAGVAAWRAARTLAAVAPHVPGGLDTVLAQLQAPRPLVRWLQDLARALEATGQWAALQADAAGQQVLAALRLGDAAHELDALGPPAAEGARAGGRLSLSAFTAWVRDVLEGVSFLPPSSGTAPVVVLPLAQLLGREVAAVVVPGCDEVHLPASVEPPGTWTPEQRERLGLPTRARLTEAARSAWAVLRGQPLHDLLWRAQDGGEALAPSPWVPAEAGDRAPAPRGVSRVVPQPTARPAAVAADLLPARLSASAYQDLRACPYRFFALRQLRLDEAAELQDAPDQRDMGTWLHEVLRRFHEDRARGEVPDGAERSALDRLAAEVAAGMGLEGHDGGAGFLPYRAQWPALRDGYLQWLAGHEAGGLRFHQAEQARQATAGRWTLHGTLDRIDLQASPEGPIAFVIDYKTESRAATRERLKAPLEDTQLAFYAALMPGDTLRAAYLSITDSRDPREAPTELVEHTDVLAARDTLVQGLVHDLDRVAAGAPMAALGEGRACEFCRARGLCRRDFWS